MYFFRVHSLPELVLSLISALMTTFTWTTGRQFALLILWEVVVEGLARILEAACVALLETLQVR